MGEEGRTDNTDIEFVTDENLIGRWGYVDFIERIEGFDSDHISWQGERYLKTLEFQPDGSMTTGTESAELLPTVLRWTEGFVLNEVEKTCSAYRIKNIGGTDYLFFEWKSGDYTLRGMDPWFYVFKKEGEI